MRKRDYEVVARADNDRVPTYYVVTTKTCIFSTEIGGITRWSPKLQHSAAAEPSYHLPNKSMEIKKSWFEAVRESVNNLAKGRLSCCGLIAAGVAAAMPILSINIIKCNIVKICQLLIYFYFYFYDAEVLEYLFDSFLYKRSEWICTEYRHQTTYWNKIFRRANTRFNVMQVYVKLMRVDKSCLELMQ